MKVLRMPTVACEPTRKAKVSIANRRGALLGAAMVSQVTSMPFPFPPGHALALRLPPGAVGSPPERGVESPVLTKPQTVFVGAGRGPVTGPSWLEGCWDVSPALVDVAFPLGKQFLRKSTPGVTKASVAEAADIGKSTPQDPVRQQMRWTAQSSPNEEGLSTVPDVIFNITSSMNALLGTDANTSVQMQNPKRLSVTFATPRRSAMAVDGGGGQGQETDPRKLELFLNYSTYKYDKDDEDIFRTDRLIRQVSQAKNQDMVGDYEISEVYHLVDEGHVEYLRMVSAFVTPMDPAYFDVGDKAVAVYTFRGRMTKTKTQTDPKEITNQ